MTKNIASAANVMHVLIFFWRNRDVKFYYSSVPRIFLRILAPCERIPGKTLRLYDTGLLQFRLVLLCGELCLILWRNDDSVAGAQRKKLMHPAHLMRKKTGWKRKLPDKKFSESQPKHFENEFFENDGVTINIWFPRLSFPQAQILNDRWVSASSSVARTTVIKDQIVN